MSDLEQTQAIFLDDYEEETDEDISKEKQIVSHLKVLCQKGFPERKFPLYEGDNIIGRQEDACNIAIPLKALSRQHACIEIRGDSHLIHDKGSRNKTKRNKLYLTPEVRYELKDNDTLTFGDVTALYLIGGDLKDNESGSETGSESEFQTPPPPASLKPLTSLSADSTNQKEVPTTLVYESDEGSDSDQSVDLLQPTQVFTNIQNGSGLLKLGDHSDEETGSSKSVSHNITVKDTPAPTKRLGREFVTVEESGSETEGEDEQGAAKEESIMMAPTQAYVRESDDDDTDIDASPVRKHLLVAETQSFTEGDGKEKPSETQTFLQDSDTDDEEDEVSKIQAAATQAFPLVSPSDNKESEIPVTEVEMGDDEDETDDEDVSHLLANPTLACDVDIDASNNEATQEFSEILVTNNGGKKSKQGVSWNLQDEPSTQVVCDATVPVSDDATQCFDDATVAITDAATQAVAVPPALGRSAQRCDEVATQVFDEDGIPETVVVAEEEECSDDIAARLTDGETLAVAVCVQGREEKEDITGNEHTQVFDDPTQKCDDATQVFDGPTQKCDDATQVFDGPTQKYDDATQVFDDPTLSTEALRKDKKQVNRKNTRAVESTLVLDNATQAMKDSTHPVINISKTAKGVGTSKNGRKKTEENSHGENDATQVIDDATQVFDDPTLPVESISKQAKGGKRSKNKGKFIDEDATQVLDDATQVFDDPTLPVENISKQAKGGKRRTNKGKFLEEDATQVLDDATQVFDDPTLPVENISKQELEATQIFDDPTLDIEDTIQQPNKSQRKRLTKKSEEQDATQVFDDATVAITDIPTEAVTREEVTQVLTETTVAIDDQTVGPSDRDTTKPLPESPAFTKTTVDNDQTQILGKNMKDGIHAGTESKSDSTVADDLKPRGRKSKLTKNSGGNNSIHEETSQKAEIDEGATPNTHATRGRGRKTAKGTASDTSQVEEPKSRRGRGRKSEPASNPDELMHKKEVKDETSSDVRITEAECTPPLDDGNVEEEEEDIQTSPPRHNRKRGRSSNMATTTAPLGRGKRAKSDKKEEAQTSTENNSAAETRGGRGRKKADKEESTVEDVKPSTVRKGKSGKTIQESKKNEVLEATQPYIDGSTVPEATQIYDMEIDDYAEATQAYTMDMQDEDSDTTPPVSDVLGVPVVEGVPTRPIPMDSDEVVPTSHSSEDSNLRSPLIPIPSRSPYKSALASPKKEKKSPSPKRVMFAKRDSEKSEEDSNLEKGRKRQNSRAAQNKGIEKESAHNTAVNTTAVDSAGDKAIGEGVQKARGRRGRKSLPAPTLQTNETATKTRGRRSALPAVSNVDDSSVSKGNIQDVTTSSSSSLYVHDTEDQTNEKVSKRTRNSATKEKEEVKKTSKKSSDKTEKDTESNKDKIDNTAKLETKKEESESETNKAATTGRRGGKRSNIGETSVKEESTKSSEESSTIRGGRGRRKGKTPDSQNTVEATSIQNASQEATSIEKESNNKALSRKGRTSNVSSDVNTSVVPDKKESRSRGRKVESESEDSQQSVTIDNSTEGKRGRSQTRKGDNVKNSSVDPQPTVKARGRVSRSSVSSQDDSMDAGSDRGAATKRKRKGEEENSQPKKTKMEPPPTPKTTKTTANIASLSLRRTSLDPSKPKVMFTGVVDEQGQKIVKDLGGELVTSMSDCTHLVTDKVRRTVKFLCCLSRGIPIVTPSWLNSSKSAAMFIDATPFLVKDPASEKQYKFCLQTSIDKARESSLLQGYKIHVTKSVRPEPPHMKDIVLSAGAEFLATMPKRSNEKTVVISCQEDRTVCEPAIKAEIPIVNAEFVLTGILQQEVDHNSFRLFDEKNGNKRGRDSSLGETTKKRKK